MIENKQITTIKDLKIYLKELLETAISDREDCCGIWGYFAEKMQKYYSQCAKIHLLQKILKMLGVNVENYGPYETDEYDNRFNYWWTRGGIGVKNNNR